MFDINAKNVPIFLLRQNLSQDLFFRPYQVECPQIEATHGLRASSSDRSLNHKVTFECTNGNSRAESVVEFH